MSDQHFEVRTRCLKWKICKAQLQLLQRLGLCLMKCIIHMLSLSTIKPSIVGLELTTLEDLI